MIKRYEPRSADRPGCLRENPAPSRHKLFVIQHHVAGRFVPFLATFVAHDQQARLAGQGDRVDRFHVIQVDDVGQGDGLGLGVGIARP